jgi:phosphoribosyl 1,2-cyclic phosphodiesterase
MAFLVRFWGTRGSIPTPGRTTHKYGGNTSCVEVSIDDTLFVLDGGTGLRELGVDLLRRPQRPIVAHFLFSHMHWDHIQGFPFFTPAYVPQNTLYIYGTSEGDRRFHKLLSGQMRSDYFPVDFSELNSHVVPADLGPSGVRVIDGVTVRCFEQKHPGGSYAYSLEKNGHKIVYATDNEIDLTLPDLDEAERDLTLPRHIPRDLVEFCAGADLLIGDGQYTEDEYPKRIGWGHPRATTVVDLAIQAGCKQLAVYHHDPMQSDHDVEAKIAACRSRVRVQGAEVFVFAAREGLELKVD